SVPRLSSYSDARQNLEKILRLYTEPERPMNGGFGGGSDGVWHNPRHRFGRWRFSSLESRRSSKQAGIVPPPSGAGSRCRRRLSTDAAGVFQRSEISYQKS